MYELAYVIINPLANTMAYRRSTSERINDMKKRMTNLLSTLLLSSVIPFIVQAQMSFPSITLYSNEGIVRIASDAIRAFGYELRPRLELQDRVLCYEDSTGEMKAVVDLRFPDKVSISFVSKTGKRMSITTLWRNTSSSDNPGAWSQLNDWQRSQHVQTMIEWHFRSSAGLKAMQ